MTLDEINIRDSEPQHHSRMTAHRALIPEILDVVLSFSDQGDCARCIRVCKDWADTAISHTWMDVHDPMVFFQMVAPLTRDNHEYEEKNSGVSTGVSDPGVFNSRFGRRSLPVKVRILILTCRLPALLTKTVLQST